MIMPLMQMIDYFTNYNIVRIIVIMLVYMGCLIKKGGKENK